MAEALKCKLCNNRHRLGDPHIWPDVKPEPKAPAVVVEKPAAAALPLDRLAILEAKEAKRLAGNAAYMRKYRARIKAL